MDSKILEKIDNKISKINENKNNIFDYIKNYKWEKLKKIIIEISKNDKNFDYNIKDEIGIYLLEYLVLFNKYDILKMINNIKIDIVDDNYRTILYNIIKYSYIELLDLILNMNDNTIGCNLLEMYDDEGNNGLFYSIKMNNIIIVEKIIKKTKNLYAKNNYGYNALHMCVKIGNIPIFSILLKYYKNINIKTDDGQSCLHIAINYKKYELLEILLKLENIDLNITENKYNYTPLHYISFNYDIRMCTLILPYVSNFNGNIQDKSGNIFIHYFLNNIDLSIDENIIKKIYDIFILINFDYNIYNIDGECCLHVLLKIYKNIKNNYNNILNNFINNTNLNIQNNDGESCLFILVKIKYWENIKDILRTKKLDIFQFNNDRKTIFYYIDDMDEFIELITESYLFQIKNINNIVFNDYWDNLCKNNIIKENIEDINNQIELYNINLNNKNLCFEIIYKKLKYNINEFLKYKILNNNVYSYPKVIIYPKLIEEQDDIIISTFTTSTIDEFFGLLYLCKKYKNTKSSLNLINLNENIVECNNYCEFIKYEFLWSNFKLYGNFDFLPNILINIKNNKDIRFFIIPIGIKIYNNKDLKGHANYLIFDFKLMEVERFEPYGSYPPQTMNYNSNSLDFQLELKINSFKINFKYIRNK